MAGESARHSATERSSNLARLVEICERRNLITHANGLVTRQYLNVCREEGVHLSNVKLGDALKVEPKYFFKAVGVLTEIGLKLGRVVWRKVSGADTQDADRSFSQKCYELIRNRRYSLAQKMLDFGV